MQQIRFGRLITLDPIYRKWLSKNPKLSGHVAFDPWRVFIQRDEGGNWAYRDYTHYVDAYTTLSKLLPKVHDAALNCRRQAFLPPKLTWKHEGEKRKVFWPRPSYHEWCPFCRRPTIFIKTRRHPLKPHIKLGEPEMLCGICGVRQEFVKSEMNTDIWSPLEWPIS